MEHRVLAGGKWDTMNFSEQMANIGSEVERSIRWKRKGNEKYFQLAFDRFLELTDLTIADSKNRDRLKEITRMREMLCDFFLFENEYGSTDEQWQKYFYAFNYLARTRF